MTDTKTKLISEGELILSSMGPNQLRSERKWLIRALIHLLRGRPTDRSGP